MIEHVVLKNVKRDLEIAIDAPVKAGMARVTVDANNLKWLIEQAEQTESFKKLHKSYLDKYVDAVGERNVLQEENKKLREALQFYANDKNYDPNVVDQWAPVVPVNKDYGEIARAVLEEDE